MSDTTPNIKLPKGGEWVDIYSVLGVIVGTSITIQSLSTSSVQFTIKATSPLSSDGHKLLLKGEQLVVPEGSSGLWMSSLPGGSINADITASISPVGLYDGFGNPIKSFKGALSAYDSDVNSKMVNEHIRRATGITDTLAAAAASGDQLITVTDGSQFAVNGHFVINEGDKHDHGMFLITGISVDDLSIDKPLESGYGIGAEVVSVVNSMNVNGAVTPVIYSRSPPADEIWHIYRLTVAMTHTSQPSDDLFGDLAKLAKGLVIRQENGAIRNLSVWRDNTDILEDTGVDLRYSAKSGGGLFGTAARWTFKRAGTVLTLDGTTGDSVKAIVQDNLSGLSDLEIKLQGHVEGE